MSHAADTSHTDLQQRLAELRAEAERVELQLTRLGQHRTEAAPAPAVEYYVLPVGVG